MLNRMAAQIAAAQLSALRRNRTVVAAPPFTALLTPGGAASANYAVFCSPGDPIDDLGESLATLQAAFAPAPARFELIDEAGPGAVDALVAAGIRVTGRYPLLTLDPASLVMPAVPHGVSVAAVSTAAQAAEAQQVANTAFQTQTDGEPDAPGKPTGGGTVLARVDGQPAATAYWTAVADGITEIVGVATMPGLRNRGLGRLVTAAAVRWAAELAGVTLAWLTPGGERADRIYRRIGFTPTAHAVHLSASG